MDAHLLTHATARSPFAEAIVIDTWPPELVALLRRIEQKEDRIMGVQDDINEAIAQFQALLAQVGATTTDLQNVAAALASEIASLESQGVDTSGLVALAGQVSGAVSNLQLAQSAVDALAPATTGGSDETSSDAGDTSADPSTDPAPADGAQADAADPASTDPTAAPAPVVDPTSVTPVAAS